MKTGGMTILALTMAVALMAAPAVAQTINLKADVPFDFEAANVKLNAGQSWLQTISNNGFIRLTDADNHTTIAMLIADDVRSASDSRLVFHRYGERYFLVGVKTTEGSYKVPLSRREMKLARHTSPAQVAVVAHAALAGK
jgi:hypothetical protein